MFETNRTTSYPAMLSAVRLALFAAARRTLAAAPRVAPETDAPRRTLSQPATSPVPTTQYLRLESGDWRVLMELDGRVVNWIDYPTREDARACGRRWTAYRRVRN
jgi:hypothetical protein